MVAGSPGKGSGRLSEGPLLDSGRLKFDREYTERVSARDGRALILRLVRPSDKTKVLLAFAQLSARSRYLRFFASKSELTDDELRFLTETDCINHFAIAALERLEDGSEGQGVGVARFVREGEEPAAAEVAITVIDEWQHRGVGRILLERLVEAARERSIERFRFECLAENEDVQLLFEEVCERVEVVGEREVLVGTATITQPRDSAAIGGRAEPSLFDLLRAVARETFEKAGARLKRH